MSTLPALYETHFPAEMLRDIILLSAPEAVAEAYGYEFERIKNLPNFKTQLARVEAELLADGTITRAIAEIGLNKAVENIALRIAGDRLSNDDLNKFTNTLHKIAARDSDTQKAAGPAFTIEINLGGETMTLTANPTKTTKTSEDVIDAELVEFEKEHGSAGEVPVLEEFDSGMDDIPDDIKQAVRESGFDLEIGD